ncbi:MAG TPA: hypothetical protein VF030_05470 [Solirubrobacterales bacterium]
MSGRSALAALALALVAVAALPAPARAEFGIASATASLEDVAGEPLLAAGAHPDLTIDVSLNTTVDAATGLPKTEGNPRSIELRLPPGLIGNPRAVPTCSRSDLVAESCPPESQVGVAAVTNYSRGPGRIQAPLFNLAPAPGAAGQLGLALFGVPVHVDLGIAAGAGGYALTAKISNLSQVSPVGRAELTLWGEPSPAGEPLITNPTECTGAPLSFQARVDSWQRPGAFSEATIDRDPEGNPLVIEGCGELPFEAALAVKPTSAEADSPSGLGLALETPWRARPRASALLRDAVVTLPEGMAVNPGTAAGLAACSPQQIDLGGGEPARCPPASQIGTARIVSPLLAEPLPGAIYLARQGENELGAPLAVYLVVDDPTSGVVLKLAGRVDPDPRTGRLTIAFEDLPQLPFERIELSLFGGERGPLTTPPACGRFTAGATLEPWNARAPLGAGDSFEIASGPDGTACPDGGFRPRLLAGAASARAGAHSPFVLRLLRPPGSAAPREIDLRLPRGLLARLAGIPYCYEAAAPACPAASRVGSVHAELGAGRFPLPLEAGGAYLSGPYRGAPLSLVLVVPAIAGPFDLGTVVTRVALHVDPRSTRLRAVSDPLPTILHGIPLQLRELLVRLDRERFMLNPTSCAPKRLGAGVVSAGGASVWLGKRFQATGCRDLAFAPRPALRLRGRTERGGYPALTARLSAKGDEARLRRLAVTLPPSLRLAQEHIGAICTRTQWAEEDCPAGSVYGTAEARTPLLGEPLRGAVYLRSSDRELPDLVVDLEGQVDLELVGHVDSSHGRLRVTFAGLPDAPVRRLTLRMRGGTRGLLVSGAGLSHVPARATVKMDGHNGAVHDRRVVMGLAPC